MKNYKGYIYAVLAYLIWGLLPLYWTKLNYLESLESLSARIIFSTIFLFIYISIKKEHKYINYIKNRKIFLSLCVNALLLAGNWGIYIFAVNNGFILQASLGYYINPLLNVLLGILIFKDSMNLNSTVAILFATIGVVYMSFGLHVIPLISLLLAGCFGFYGLIKKQFALESFNSLFIEVLLMFPFACLYIGYTVINGTSNLRFSSISDMFLVTVSGIITILPLVLFAEGAKRISLSSIGFLQFIAPTLMFLIGVLFLGSSFTIVHLVSFSFIWLGCFIYIFSLYSKIKTLN